MNRYKFAFVAPRNGDHYWMKKISLSSSAHEEVAFEIPYLARSLSRQREMINYARMSVIEGTLLTVSKIRISVQKVFKAVPRQAEEAGCADPGT